MAKKTRICCLDVDKSIENYLREEHDVYSGSMGVRLSMPESRMSSSIVAPNYDFPLNMHEYDVYVIDMIEGVANDYYPDDYIPQNNETVITTQMCCDRSISVFNPIPYGACAFSTRMQVKKDKRPIIIAFQYEFAERTYLWSNANRETHTNYDFIWMPRIIERHGYDVNLTDRAVSELLFKNHLNDVKYYCVFDCGGLKDYYPLLVNNNGECVSYVQLTDDAIVFMLPQMKDKAAFLKFLFENVLYEEFSDYFPAVEEKRWIHKEEYMLPNEEGMRGELEQARKDYEAKKDEIEARIKENAGHYEFLHTMITGTGSELVNAVIEYLKWLGFEDVVNADEDEGREFNEEDIRVTIPNGLFILEVKGIHHNSTDDECARVEKYKLRWMDELDTRNIKALYVVNHQRSVEPLKRKNPPFTKVQKSDAKRGLRGLVTTWQLYNLYFDIERGIFDKAEAREALMQYGWVDFVPKGAVNLGKPYNYYQNNVICVELKGQNVTRGDEMYAYDGRNWHKAEVLTIEIDDQRLESADNGNVGFGLSEELPEHVDVYVRKKGE